jgi:hypothetical protein
MAESTNFATGETRRLLFACARQHYNPQRRGSKQEFKIDRVSLKDPNAHVEH